MTDFHIVDWPPASLRTLAGTVYVYEGRRIVAGPFKSETLAQAWIDSGKQR